MNVKEVIQIFSEATSGPISSSPSAATPMMNTTPGQDMNQPEPVKPQDVQNMAQQAIQNVGQQMNLQPNQVPDFAEQFKNQIQKELTDLQNKAKTQQNMTNMQ